MTRETDRPTRRSPHGVGNRLRRALWQLAWRVSFRWTPVPLHGWRRLVLRVFGARIGTRTLVYPDVRVWAPWHLEIGDGVSIGPGVNLYCVGKLTIGDSATVSQDSVLTGATHDYSRLDLPLMPGDIDIGSQAWICADVIVMPGVRIGEGAVIGVRSTVLADVPPWKVAAGTPCRVVKDRVIG